MYIIYIIKPRCLIWILLIVVLVNYAEIISKLIFNPYISPFYGPRECWSTLTGHLDNKFSLYPKQIPDHSGSDCKTLLFCSELEGANGMWPRPLVPGASPENFPSSILALPYAIFIRSGDKRRPRKRWYGDLGWPLDLVLPPCLGRIQGRGRGVKGATFKCLFLGDICKLYVWIEVFFPFQKIGNLVFAFESEVAHRHTNKCLV